MPDQWANQQGVMKQTGLSYKKVRTLREKGVFRTAWFKNMWWINLTAFFQDLEYLEQEQLVTQNNNTSSPERDLEAFINSELKSLSAKHKNKSNN